MINSADDRDNLKQGDECYVIDTQGKLRREKVKARKRRWLTTTSGLRFDITKGYEGASIYGCTPSLRTIGQRETFQRWMQLKVAAQYLAERIPCRMEQRSPDMPLEEVIKFTEVLEEFANRVKK